MAETEAEMEKPVTMVTGVSKGIGKAIAEDMTARGHHVVGLSRTRPGAWFTGSHFAVDLADAKALAETLQRVVAAHRVLRLVNNAAISIAGTAEKLTVKDLDDVMALNFRAVLQCTQAVLPAMRAARFGRIVNLGSRALLGREGRIAYGGSKAAVLSMTRSLALEVANDGITANCIAPGPVETEMFAQNHPHGSAERARITGAVPMARVGTTKEVAAACAYFLSDDAGFTTGQVLYVDGGLSVGLAPM
jgi:3-oxoacyl-[acyl-carrier protein] reductase